MSPREETPLLGYSGRSNSGGNEFISEQQQQDGNATNKSALGEYDEIKSYSSLSHFFGWAKSEMKYFLAGVVATSTVVGIALLLHSLLPEENPVLQPTGSYMLVERHVGDTFFHHYHFFSGNDSVGSAGHQIYVDKKRAANISIFNVSKEEDGTEVIFMKSAPTAKGPRESIRLEGKRRFNRGLFVLDLDHMPAGAGVWPAFWMTDEAHWPNNGEIDIVENINNQTQAKTALHTSGQCRMYGNEPKNSFTGYWDRATAIPDPSTNISNTVTNIEADDCWNLAAHRWYNQGCVIVDDEDGTIGKPVNDRGGSVYALELDPQAGYIKSWFFHRHLVPENLEHAMATSNGTSTDEESPNPKEGWGLPYAYFAIGPKSDCSADHFQNMHLVFNLAFCGEVAGNRFFKDCHEESKEFNVSNHPINSCNAYIESNPKALDEAYWKIRGVYVWEREMQLG